MNLTNKDYNIIVVDNEPRFLDFISLFLEKSGYKFMPCDSIGKAVETLNVEYFDVLILNSSMLPKDPERIINQFRTFNTNIHIILISDEEDNCPSLDTIRELNIQSHYKKDESFNELILLIESGIKSVKQLNEIKIVNQKLQNTYDMLERSYFDSIQLLRYTVEAKDTYTRGHSDRVSEYSVLIGKYLNMSNDDLKTLQIGGLFHDIGKLGVPDAILQKEGKLTDEEYIKIKSHPLIGAQIISRSTVFKDIVPIIKHHHERYDGNRIS